MVMAPGGVAWAKPNNRCPSPTVTPAPRVVPLPPMSKMSWAFRAWPGRVGGCEEISGPKSEFPPKIYGDTVEVLTAVKVRFVVGTETPNEKPPIVTDVGPVLVRVTSKLPELPALKIPDPTVTIKLA